MDANLANLRKKKADAKEVAEPHSCLAGLCELWEKYSIFETVSLLTLMHVNSKFYNLMQRL